MEDQPNRHRDKTPEQIDNYYTLNLKHLSWSFWSSIIGLFIGLIALLFGVYKLFQGDLGANSQLSVVGGVLTEFISAGFFILYSQNLKQLNIFYQRLIQHQGTLYAISLTREINDPAKPELMKAIIGKLLSAGESEMTIEKLRVLLDREPPRIAEKK